MPDFFDHEQQTLDGRLVSGLSKIGQAIKSRAWQEASARGLTPTQGQILTMLSQRDRGMRLSEVAQGLGVSLPTASDAVAALADKGLVHKERSPEDGRALCVSLTPLGRKEGEQAASWPDFLLQGMDALSPQEREIFLRSLVKMIRALQSQGRIPVQRMCVSCRYFRPYAHADAALPHHCKFVDAAFGEGDLRLECPEQERAPLEDQEATWNEFLAGPKRSEPAAP